jgi:hypothetical protein
MSTGADEVVTHWNGASRAQRTLTEATTPQRATS